MQGRSWLFVVIFLTNAVCLFNPEMILNCIITVEKYLFCYLYLFHCYSERPLSLSLSLALIYLGSTVWELLVQGIWSGSVQYAQTNCEGHGFAPADCFASAGETEPAPGRQTA